MGQYGEPWRWEVPSKEPGWTDCGPWLVDSTGKEVLGSWGFDAWGLTIADWEEPERYPSPPPDSPLATRIVACVNACSDIPNPEAVPGLVEAVLAFVETEGDHPTCSYCNSPRKTHPTTCPLWMAREALRRAGL